MYIMNGNGDPETNDGRTVYDKYCDIFKSISAINIPIAYGTGTVTVITRAHIEHALQKQNWKEVC